MIIMIATTRRWPFVGTVIFVPLLTTLDLETQIETNLYKPSPPGTSEPRSSYHHGFCQFLLLDVKPPHPSSLVPESEPDPNKVACRLLWTKLNPLNSIFLPTMGLYLEVESLKRYNLS